MASRYRKIRTELHEGRFTITLNAPERRNAIGSQMVSELLYALEDAAANRDARVVVLAGDGKAFCAGGDFGQMTGSAEGQDELPLRGSYAELLKTMVHFEKPIVARVHGAAMGGGLGLVAASTFAIGSTDATLGTPEINVGLFPMMIMAVLSRIVPRRDLLRMMLLGDKIDAQEGYRLGLLSAVAAPDELDARVADLVGRLASKSPIALALGLRAFAAQGDLSLEESLPMLESRLGEILGTDDAREGLMAFLEKRPATWTGR